jgi:hypothetical protein
MLTGSKNQIDPLRNNFRVSEKAKQKKDKKLKRRAISMK